MVSKGIHVSKLYVVLGVLAGVGAVLLVGLTSGLVARPRNCIRRPVSPTSSTPSTSSSSTSNGPSSTASSGTSTITTRTSASSQGSTSTSNGPSSTASSGTSTITTRTSASSQGSTSTSTPVTTKSTSLETVTRTLPPTSTFSTNPPLTTGQTSQNIRLPENQIPTNYNLELKVFFDPIGDNTKNDRFEGRVVIDFNLTSSSQKIVLHIDETLNITNNIEIENLQNSQKITINNYNYLDNQLFEINLNQVLPTGRYKLKIDYVGNYGPVTNLYGFYKTRYNEDGVTKNLVATKFEPTDARKAFPCFDEPALKASFEITIEHPNGTIALSNWPENPRVPVSGNRFRTSFEKTYPMATYLAAWTVLPDDYGKLEATSSRGKKIRVYARKDAVNKGLADFALEVTQKSIDFFETKYFIPELNAVPPKIDSIGFPDFSAGAMEHWGLIGYRETYFLYSEDRNTLIDKQNVASTIAHEVSHFWFGNLVTCKWWDDLWLNEAMATFLEQKAVQHIYQDIDYENQFIVNNLIPVMYDDAFQTSNPVQNQILTPAQINSAFSSITYDKGCALLRMLESTVGSDNFRQGLIDFLKKNEFQAAVAADFYNSLKLPVEMTGVSPQEYMENWLLQMNYPEVTVLMETITSRSVIKFVQGRFLLSPEGLDGVNDTSPFNYKWMIYLQCKAGGSIVNGVVNHLEGESHDFNYFLKDTEGSILLPRRFTWVKCNKDFKGFYVTDYEESNFQALESVLVQKKDLFSIGDRSNLIHVAYSLAYLGSKSYRVPAYLTNYLEAWERDYVPWKTFMWHMNKIANILEHRPGFIDLKDFGSSVLGSLTSSINLWDDSGDHKEKLLKINVIDFLCRMQEENCLKNASFQFEKIDAEYFTNPSEVVNKVPPNLRGLVLKYHVQNTYDYTDWFKVLDVYSLTIDPQERAQVINAISNTRLPWIVDIELFELLESNSKIRAQDFFTLLNSIGKNPSGRHIAWYFLRHYWYQLVNKFGVNSRALAGSVKSVCSTFESSYLLKEMNNFFATTNPGTGIIQRLQALDIVKHNIVWIIDREPDVIANFFKPSI